MVQEIDIESGNLVFQWRSSDYFPVEKTFIPLGKQGRSSASAFDYFHLNSVDKDASGNFIISARHLHMVACLSPSGDVLWELGGQGNMFRDLSNGTATSFSWQHHANWYLNDTLTLFDNGATYDEVTAGSSRALLLALDLDDMTATLVESYVHPRRYLAPAQGSLQVLPGGKNIFVGYGNLPAYAEFGPNGEVLCDVTFGSMFYYKLGWVQSYRAIKAPWVGNPHTAPSTKLKRGFRTVLYVSWNGATEVVAWRLESSSSVAERTNATFTPIAEVFKDGFETFIIIPANVDKYLRVAAIDIRGTVLRYSNVISSDSGDVLDPHVIG